MIRVSFLVSGIEGVCYLLEGNNNYPFLDGVWFFIVRKLKHVAYCKEIIESCSLLCGYSGLFLSIRS